MKISSEKGKSRFSLYMGALLSAHMEAVMRLRRIKTATVHVNGRKQTLSEGSSEIH
jgi:hypothetical protein